jgi:MFS family permease
MKKLRPIFFASFLFSIHVALLAYINSTVLGSFVGQGFIGVVYTISSALALILVFFAGRLIQEMGLVRLAAITLTGSAFSLILIGSASSSAIVIPLFIFYFSLNAVMFYCFDMFIEHYSREHNTGNIRGLYLTLNNAGWVLIPSIVGAVSSTYGYSVIYVAAACMVLLSLGVLAGSQHKYKDSAYHPHSVGQIFKELRKAPAIRRIMALNFMLQFFFSWMVIYTPLYLTKVIGFDWRVLGILFSIMLLPFVLFQLPVGKMADRIGEKYLITAGFLIAGIATLLFSYLGAGTFIAYAAVLFLTRVGASFIEVSADSYFFKHVSDKDTATVGIYRNMMPIAYIIGPLLAAIIISRSNYPTLFFSLSIALFIASLYALRLKN